MYVQGKTLIKYLSIYLSICLLKLKVLGVIHSFQYYYCSNTDQQASISITTANPRQIQSNIYSASTALLKISAHLDIIFSSVCIYKNSFFPKLDKLHTYTHT